MLLAPAPKGPSVSSGKNSRQDYATPRDFIRAVEARFGRISWDLAADYTNYKGPEGRYFDLEDDSLKQDWHKLGGLLWLNPPFKMLGPWIQKCSEEWIKGAQILLLAPASVGSNWFAEYIHGKHHVLFLSPRLTFDGCSDPYPKDLMLIHFALPDGAFALDSYQCWRWDKPWP